MESVAETGGQTPNAIKGGTKMANELDINEVLKTIPPEMVEDMKKQAEKYGFPFEEYVQSVLGAIVMDPDLGAY